MATALPYSWLQDEEIKVIQGFQLTENPSWVDKLLVSRDCKLAHAFLFYWSSRLKLRFKNKIIKHFKMVTTEL